jgi:hypothetical protein
MRNPIPVWNCDYVVSVSLAPGNCRMAWTNDLRYPLKARLEMSGKANWRNANLPLEDTDSFGRRAELIQNCPIPQLKFCA